MLAYFRQTICCEKYSKFTYSTSEGSKLAHLRAPCQASYFNKLIDDSFHNDHESKSEPNNTSGRDSEYDNEDLLPKHT